MRELYVYYRVRPDDVPGLTIAVRRLQAQLRAEHPGLIARLLHRPLCHEGSQTWMETYSTAPDAPAIDDATQARIDALASALLPMIDGPRRTEVFIACAS